MNRQASAFPFRSLLLATALLAVPAAGAAAQGMAPEAFPPAAVPPPEASNEPPLEPLAAPGDAPQAANATVPYEVTLTGVEDDGLSDTLEAASSLFGLREDPPPSILGLERRAAADRDRLQAALRSAGYYDARLDIAVDAESQPARVTVAVEPGPAYRFKTITLRNAEGTGLPGEPIDPAALGLRAGEQARAPQVISAQSDLLARLTGQGFGFAEVTDREVVVDHSDRTMDVAYTVKVGPRVRYGAVRVEGATDVDEDLIRGRLPWRTGDIHDPKQLDTARQRIAQLEVFDTVRVALAPEPGPDGVTPVIVTVAERKRRFLGLAATYSTADGIGGQAYWGHRNLFGGAEQFRVSVEVGRLAGESGSGNSDGERSSLDLPDLRFGVSFRKPDFLANRQSLLLNFQVASEQPPAYDLVGTTLSAGLERVVTEQLTLSYGVTSEASRILTTDRTYRTALIGAPVGLTWQGTDDLLNPTRGERASIELAPWFPAGGDSVSSFVSARLNGSVYHDISGDGRYVAAARVGFGSIIGASLDEIPPNHRFYAGGGGSVRGYAFQKAGPRDRADNPTGGRSLFEAGLELRIKVTESIGIVPFLDAGTVYDSTLPNLGQPLRFGAGLGLRYYTAFGPLRVDVGVPLNPDEDDDRWQLYLSLGQAF
ncbi:autotransporter assembly complex family protein [Azospirillum sp. SYSU D00513]|uniref:autotransporter assembly complex protein TamA n=1 Tax=Azospirillum sp. SYSU D00513 TaxID=2812561 RepID=UPI001FFFAAFF|nr:autotransporter assembly complex family protein [Azospirillum sp. SYSU D00513]